MNIARWRRMRQVRRRRRLVAKLREANRALQSSYEGLKANQAYYPSCMGGVEDKYAGERQWQNSIGYWSSMVEQLTRNLRLTREQAARYR